MASWIDVKAELPAANRVVEVCVEMSRGLTAQLRGYLLLNRVGGDLTWLNATTNQPFPGHWRITKWRAMNGETLSGEPMRVTDLMELRRAELRLLANAK
jgi:hypothetical protein